MIHIKAISALHYYLLAILAKAKVAEVALFGATHSGAFIGEAITLTAAHYPNRC